MLRLSVYNIIILSVYLVLFIFCYHGNYKTDTKYDNNPDIIYMHSCTSFEKL